MWRSARSLLPSLLLPLLLPPSRFSRARAVVPIAIARWRAIRPGRAQQPPCSGPGKLTPSAAINSPPSAATAR
ncbi:hypothetical protein BS50DRAFT_569965 [Corynespora cassiicola Philippines]|uniref:Secreted protein n=1 Tax=Corynespora cassiicola Philippines TaxID=1448308 RepID=A0A2T2P466_CORCC|nr:hypothetical protein BS50DRAFT_569965 [Corynespora cassiicola Philippines]